METTDHIQSDAINNRSNGKCRLIAMKWVCCWSIVFLLGCETFAASHKADPMAVKLKRDVHYNALMYPGDALLEERIRNLQKEYSNTYSDDLPIRLSPKVAKYAVNVEPKKQAPITRDTGKTSPNLMNISVRDLLQYVCDVLQVKVTYQRDCVIIEEKQGP